MTQDQSQSESFLEFAKKYKYFWVIPVVLLAAIMGIILFSLKSGSSFIYSRF